MYHGVIHGFILSWNQVENSILELLVDNLSRLNEEEESDRQGIFHVLGRSKLLRKNLANRDYRNF